MCNTDATTHGDSITIDGLMDVIDEMVEVVGKNDNGDSREKPILVISGGIGQLGGKTAHMLEALREHYAIQVVEHMPKEVVLGDVAQLPPVDFVDVIANRNHLVDVIANRNHHLLHGRGSKGDRIRRRQQFNNQCGYKGRRK